MKMQDYSNKKLAFLSQRVFFAHSAGNRSNWHRLESEAECKEQVEWSEQQEVDTAG